MSCLASTCKLELMVLDLKFRMLLNLGITTVIVFEKLCTDHIKI